MPIQIGAKTALTAALITFAICAGGGYGLLAFGPWTSVAAGLLFSALTFGAVMLAATATRARGPSFWVFWTPGRVLAYNAVMGVVLIALGIWLGLVLETRGSAAIAIICVSSGLLMIAGSLVEHVRLRRRRERE